MTEVYTQTMLSMEVLRKTRYVHKNKQFEENGCMPGNCARFMEFRYLGKPQICLLCSYILLVTICFWLLPEGTRFLIRFLKVSQTDNCMQEELSNCTVIRSLKENSSLYALF